LYDFHGTRVEQGEMQNSAITSTCATLGQSPEEGGHGLLDCVAAMHAV
jgi:hypothetical protein